MNLPLLLIILLLLFPATTVAQSGRPSTNSSTSGNIVRPRLADSATGYIDNAIIGSQFRIRFDSGFGVDAPDRAEFFYGKCGCYRFLDSRDPAFDPAAPGPGTRGQVEGDLNFQEFRFDAEVAIGDRFSLLAEVPVRAIEPRTVGRFTGIGDIRVGIKGGIVANDDTAVTAQLRTYIPSGDARKGLGTNHTSIEPSLVVHHNLSDDFTVAAQAGIWLPIRGSAGVPTGSSDKFAGNVFLYGFGGSYNMVDTSTIRVAPVVEFVGWRVLGGFQTLPSGPATADGVNIANVKIGTRIDSGGPGSFYVGFGHALTNAVWYSDIVRAEYRFAF